MPNMPPADRKHGSGDRNENDVARHDEKLQDRRDKKTEKGEAEVKRQSDRDIGTDH
ncbi:MAG: hypothetical protein ABI300_11925 [Rhodanobacter sp.]